MVPEIQLERSKVQFSGGFYERLIVTLYHNTFVATHTCSVRIDVLGYHCSKTEVYKMTPQFVCVEVLRPSQPNGVMSSAFSLPNHTFTGQA